MFLWNVELRVCMYSVEEKTFQSISTEFAKNIKTILVQYTRKGNVFCKIFAIITPFLGQKLPKISYICINKNTSNEFG